MESRGCFCLDCGYDLRGSAERCPECGRSFDTNDRRTFACQARRSYPWLGLAGVVLAITSAAWQLHWMVGDARFVARHALGGIFFYPRYILIQSQWHQLWHWGKWLWLPVAGCILAHFGMEWHRRMARTALMACLLGWTVCYLVMQFRVPLAKLVSGWLDS